MFCDVDCMVVDDPHEVVDSPDCAMFEVVQDGRNCVECFLNVRVIGTVMIDGGSLSEPQQMTQQRQYETT